MMLVVICGAASAVVQSVPEYQHGVDAMQAFAPELSTAVKNYDKLSSEDKSALSKFKISDLNSRDFAVVDAAYAKVDSAMRGLFGTKSGMYSLFVLDRAKKAFDFGKLAESEKLIRTGMASFPANAPLTLKYDTAEHLAYLVSKRDPKEGIKYEEQSLELAKQMSGSKGRDADEYLTRMRSLAFAHFTNGEYVEALPIYRKREVEMKDVYGAYSFEYGESLSDLGRVELALNDYQNAEKHLVASLEVLNKPAPHNRMRTVLERWSIITAENCLAQTYMAENKLAPAAKCEDIAIEMCTADGQPHAFNTVQLSRILRSEKKFDKARKVLTDDLKNAETEQYRGTELELGELAVIAALQRKTAEADEYLKQWRTKISDDYKTSVAENDFKQLSSEKLAGEVNHGGIKPIENADSFDDLEPHVTLNVVQFQNLIAHRN
ncbi:MAG TPA: tetratricopeptide repeat protein [Drouetiella sp.]